MSQVQSLRPFMIRHIHKKDLRLPSNEAVSSLRRMFTSADAGDPESCHKTRQQNPRRALRYHVRVRRRRGCLGVTRDELLQGLKYYRSR